MKTNDRGLSALLALTELPRAAVEASTLVPALPMLASVPAGDGHPVIVVPPFGLDDESTLVLRTYFDLKGYDVHGWGLGTNLGWQQLGGYDGLVARVTNLYRTSGLKRVSLVGWSLGGVHVRAVAKVAPLAVRQVISVGAPIGGPIADTAIWEAFRRTQPELSATLREGMKLAEPFRRIMHEPPPGIPTTAVYSRSDAVVPWHLAMELERRFTENIEVYSSHTGLGVNPAVLYAIADRLAQPRNRWQRFDRSGWRATLYGPAERP